MSSKAEVILDRVKTALAGSSGVSTRIYRSRVEALARKEFPALVIEPISATADRPSVDRISWALLFQVFVLVRADVPDQSADPTMLDVHSKIMGDATLDGMLTDLSPAGTDWRFEEADKPLGIISMQYRAEYQTSYNDLSA